MIHSEQPNNIVAGSWEDFVAFMVYQVKLCVWLVVAIELCTLVGNFLGTRV
jgi:heme exporter protein D